MEAAIDLIGMGTFTSSSLFLWRVEVGSSSLPSLLLRARVEQTADRVALLSVLPNAGRWITITGPYRSSCLPAGPLLSRRV